MSEIILNVKGLQIKGKQWGNPSGPPVLALHGWLDNAGSFDLLAPLLPDLNLMAIDFPGHGLSEHQHTALTHHFLDGVPIVDAIADHYQWSKFSIIGHSMGAAIAVLYAGSVPDRLDKLILIENLGPLVEDVLSAAEQMQLFMKSVPMIKPPTIHDTLEKAVTARLKFQDISKQHATILAERGTHAINGGYQWRHDPKLRLPSAIFLTEQQVTSFLHFITADTTIILAENGFPYDQKTIEHRIRLIKHHDLYTLPGGHSIHMEQPEQVAEIIQQAFNKDLK